MHLCEGAAVDHSDIPVYQVYANDGGKQAFAEQQQPARWTSGRLPCVYASCRAAAALLEFLAHLEGSPPQALCCAKQRIAAALVEDLDALPNDWNRLPYRESVQQVGDAWLASRRSLALRVPSALAPATFNLLLNPSHPAFDASAVESIEVFRLDHRLA